MSRALITIFGSRAAVTITRWSNVATIPPLLFLANLIPHFTHSSCPAIVLRCCLGFSLAQTTALLALGPGIVDYCSYDLSHAVVQHARRLGDWLPTSDTTNERECGVIQSLRLLRPHLKRILVSVKRS